MTVHYDTIKRIKSLQDFSKHNYSSYTCLCGNTVGREIKHRCFSVIDDVYLGYLIEGFELRKKSISGLIKDVEQYKQWVKEIDDGKDDVYDDYGHMKERIENYPKLIEEYKLEEHPVKRLYECCFCKSEMSYDNLKEASKEGLPWVEWRLKYICSECVFNFNIAL